MATGGDFFSAPRSGLTAGDEFFAMACSTELNTTGLDDGHRETGHALVQLPANQRLKSLGDGHKKKWFARRGCIRSRASIRSGDFVLLDQLSSTRSDGGREVMLREARNTAVGSRGRSGDGSCMTGSAC